jgi:crotonobetaine/carnitine-CoA ligase
MADHDNPFLLWQCIARAASTQPDLDVLTFENKGRIETRTYRALWQNARCIARALQTQGLRPGESFALLMPNHPEFVEAMIAASLTGSVFVPIDPRARGDKLAFMLDHAQCRGVIASDEALGPLQAVRTGRPHLRWMLALNSGECVRIAADWKGVLPLQDVLEQPAPEPEAPVAAAQDPLAPWQILYTSGTTGDPKGIVMDQRRYIENALATRVLCGYTAEDRPYTGLSFTHANAQVLTLGSCLVQGMRGVFSRRFTKSRLWDIARQFGCTTFNLLGGMTTAIYAEEPRNDDANNPVRFVLSAGMPAAIWSDFERRFRVKVLEFYGAAEGGLTFNPMGVGPVGSIGRPVPSLKHRIVDDKGQDVVPDARGERTGELLFQPADGRSARVEYLHNPEASEKKSRGGWLWMGDIVREDAHGWLYFLYRKGGSIRRNGEFIEPAPIEKLIAEDPHVDDVYVYGVPAVTGVPGEKDIVAAVVPNASHAFDPQRLFAHCRKALHANAVPSFIQVLAEIPKTASEKPQDRFLLEAFERQPAQVHTEQGLHP